MRGLEGRAVVVTGGASGIGQAIAQRLAEEGCCVGVFDRDEQGAKTTVDLITEKGGKASGYAVDITDYDAVKEAVSGFRNQSGRIDGLVNNAGIDIPKTFSETSPDDWRPIIDVNLYGPLNVTHSVLPHMIEEKFGRVVTIASDAARVGSSGEAVYSACKGGVISLMKSLARENMRHGISFNAVCPGPTDTPLLDVLDDKLKSALERAIPMRRLGQPEDYPGIVALLLSDDAGYITGQTVSVSGGLTMNG